METASPDFDVIVIGAGMAGASAAAALAEHGRVVVLEREAQAGLHATGRSAALFSETYGNAAVRGLSRASRAFLEDPPDDFCETPLLAPRGAMFIASDTQRPTLDAMAADDPGAFTPLTGDAARGIVPVLRPKACAAALLEAGAMDIDVNALHQGYLRRLRQRGGEIVLDVAADALGREADRWTVRTGAGSFSAPVVVNAAGAWADPVAALAGLKPLGLAPKRRTAAIIDASAGLDISGWPLVIDADEGFYFKPDAGRLLISPADETDSPPCDAQPDEMDIAIAADRIQAATTLEIRRIAHRWAGLRTFAPDRTPVCGFDPRAPGFFWLAGQGGYGIQTAPALAALSARLITGKGEAPDVDAGALAPERLLGR